MHTNRKKQVMGKFELITGPMSCGKTEELIRRIKRCVIAGQEILVFSPTIDNREVGEIIKSRNGSTYSTIKIKEAKDILTYVKETTKVIAIDEMQFFGEDIISVIKTLIKTKRIIGCGLDLDFKGEPFGYMPQLMCYATSVDKLTAICMKCHEDNATHSQRIINGKPASKDSPLIVIGADEAYEARCINCWECN